MMPKESKARRFRSIRYYFKIWFTVLKLSMSRDLMYRFDFLLKVARTLMILGVQIFLVRALFIGTDEIAGLDTSTYYLLIGVFDFVIYLSWGIFTVNLWRMEERVLRGQFDYTLLYPSGSAFSSSFLEFHFDDAVSAFAGLILIIYYFFVNWSTLSFLNITMFLIALFLAFVIWYAIQLIVASTNLFMPKNGLYSLTKSISRAGSVPIGIFSTSGKVILFTLLPVALISILPTNLLAGIYSLKHLLLAILVVFIWLLVAKKVWFEAQKKYVSFGG